ncbi:hypothetical protein BC834DRAFT_98816 [Gloeopeniophorella convolvens]|nr:hypothetical protein BC834DRAFT_98816 [Gloeopeniophorella convolvens]
MTSEDHPAFRWYHASTSDAHTPSQPCERKSEVTTSVNSQCSAPSPVTTSLKSLGQAPTPREGPRDGIVDYFFRQSHTYASLP